MQALDFTLPACYFCLKRGDGQIHKMEPIGNGIFHCANCNQNHQEDIEARPRFNPALILSGASLPVLNVLYGVWVSLYKAAPMELQIAAGGFLFTGYLLKGLRLLGR